MQLTDVGLAISKTSIVQHRISRESKCQMDSCLLTRHFKKNDLQEEFLDEVSEIKILTIKSIRQYWHEKIIIKFIVRELKKPTYF